jgi:hypothetical protein
MLLCRACSAATRPISSSSSNAGVPRRLSETDRRIIADHFGVSESVLGAPDASAPRRRCRQLQASAASTQAERTRGHPLSPVTLRAIATLAVDQQFLQRLSGGRVPSLSAHAIDSDCMAPTLVAGDQVLIDTADRRAPRDGIYVIESDGALLVKRLSVHPVTRRIAVLSDNAAYPSFPDCDPDGVHVIGRVFWVGRRLP